MVRQRDKETERVLFLHGEELDKMVATKIMGLVEGEDFGEWDEHVWQLDKHGNVCWWAYENDYHNGPRCTRCGYSYCMHCEDGPSERCIVDPLGYSTSVFFVARVEGKIEERKLEGEYVEKLRMVIDVSSNKKDKEFAMVSATPEQRCKAALLVVMQCPAGT